MKLKFFSSLKYRKKSGKEEEIFVCDEEDFIVPEDKKYNDEYSIATPEMFEIMWNTYCELAIYNPVNPNKENSTMQLGDLSYVGTNVDHKQLFFMTHIALNQDLYNNDKKMFFSSLKKTQDKYHTLYSFINDIVVANKKITENEKIDEILSKAEIIMDGKKDTKRILQEQLKHFYIKDGKILFSKRRSEQLLINFLKDSSKNSHGNIHEMLFYLASSMYNRGIEYVFSEYSFEFTQEFSKYYNINIDSLNCFKIKKTFVPDLIFLRFPNSFKNKLIFTTKKDLQEIEKIVDLCGKFKRKFFLIAGSEAEIYEEFKKDKMSFLSGKSKLCKKIEHVFNEKIELYFFIENIENLEEEYNKLINDIELKQPF